MCSKYQKRIEYACEIIVFWRKNLVMLPTGAAAKLYVLVIIDFMNIWSNNSSVKYLIFKTVLLVPSLLLQKPSKASKSKDYLRVLKRRMDL